MDDKPSIQYGAHGGVRSAGAEERKQKREDERAERRSPGQQAREEQAQLQNDRITLQRCAAHLPLLDKVARAHFPSGEGKVDWPAISVNVPGGGAAIAGAVTVEVMGFLNGQRAAGSALFSAAPVPVS